MALPPGCYNICRPRRRSKRIYRPNDLTRITRYVVSDFGEIEACNAVSKAVQCCTSDCSDVRDALLALDLVMARIRDPALSRLLDKLNIEVIGFPSFIRFTGVVGTITSLLKAASSLFAIYSLVSTANASETRLIDVKDTILDLVKKYDIFVANLDLILDKVCR